MLGEVQHCPEGEQGPAKGPVAYCQSRLSPQGLVVEHCLRNLHKPLHKVGQLQEGRRRHSHSQHYSLPPDPVEQGIGRHSLQDHEHQTRVWDRMANLAKDVYAAYEGTSYAIAASSRVSALDQTLLTHCRTYWLP